LSEGDLLPNSHPTERIGFFIGDYMRKLIYDVGINDIDYPVARLVSGKLIKCEYYARWHNMLQRCYDKKFLARNKTYQGCTVCDEWLIFSNFKSWMEQQDWKCKFLDKDIIIDGNKIYSPSTSRFVCRITNNFYLDTKAARGSLLIGACLHKRDNKYYAYCRNPFTKRLEHLGVYSTELEAHQAWKARKSQLSIDVAAIQNDSDIGKAILNKYRT
jgi:hypothetical protein